MAELKIQDRKPQDKTGGSVRQRKGAAVLRDNRGLVSETRALTDNRTVQLEPNSPLKPNNTGLPNQLKAGIESLSGMSMDHVKVHYNSSQPAQLNAHAYAQGSDIHVASGQEKHLPHEAWHVVQQAQGRVKQTVQMKGSQINDNQGLEREADLMGGRALQMYQRQKTIPAPGVSIDSLPSGLPIQRYKYLDSSNYLSSPSASFESQSVGKDIRRAGYAQSTKKKPNIKVATDSSLAIENTSDQPKNFYADSDVISKSNNQLAAAESPIRLMPISGLISTPKLTALQKTVWRLNGEMVPGTTLGVHICNETASKVAGGISMGPGAKAVLHSTKERQDTSKEHITNLNFHPMSNAQNTLAAGLALQDDASPDALGRLIDKDGYQQRRQHLMEKYAWDIQHEIITHDAVYYALPGYALTQEMDDKLFVLIQKEFYRTRKTVTEEGLSNLVNKAFGSMSKDTRDKKSKAAGVNEYAQAGVGEAQATFTMGNLDYTGEHPDYAHQLQDYATKIKMTLQEAALKFEGVKVEGGWTWHFAATVAESQDGKDYITLENYNRGPEAEKETDRVYKNLLSDFAGFRQFLKMVEFAGEEMDAMSKDKQQKTYISIASKLSNQADIQLLQALVKAKVSLEKLEKIDKGSLWYFRMYGPVNENILNEKGEIKGTEDQTFHREMVKSGEFANPLTVRFRGDALHKNLGASPKAHKYLSQAQGGLIEVMEQIKLRKPFGEIVPNLKRAKQLIDSAENSYKKDLRGNQEENASYVELLRDFYEDVKHQAEKYLRNQK